MRGGRTIATVDPKTVSLADLTELTVGSAQRLPPRASAVRGDHRLNVAGLRCARSDGHVMLNDATFFVRAGEIYGIAGVSGNGQAELAEALIGVREPLAGEIWIEGAGDLAHAGPAERRGAGIASIPADRYAYALAGDLSIVENFGIGRLHEGRYGPWARIDYAAMRADTDAAVRAFDVQGVRSPRQKAALLSGGNAQKLVIAREFSRSPAVIVAQSPSRGLDARACAAVHQRLLAARDAQAAVVLISEDLDEVLALSDRVAVMSRGRIAAEFAAPADRQAVGRAMVDHA
jgi:simple sugar transport system ATP-binding protein